MKLFLIAGEASGDLHGSNLIRALKTLHPQLTIRCWGGDLMEAAGATVLKHYRELAFMGFSEVLRNLGTIMKNFKTCKAQIEDWQPDAIIYIDYPGFNLRMAKWAKSKSYTNIYYISPQVWAWKENRVKTIRRCIDQMLVILPFEKEFYRKWQYEVIYTGHPLVEVVDRARNHPPTHETLARIQKPVIALLPGSRKQEIHKKLPVMLSVAQHFPEYQFVVAMAPGQEDALYESMMAPYQNVTAVRNATYALLLKSHAALVTSGTATLETALFGVPEVVCYKGHHLSYLIAKRLIKIKYISLVNLIMDRETVKELIQNELTTDHLCKELKRLLDPEQRKKIETDYLELRQKLQVKGEASANAAREIIQFLERKQ